MADLAPVTVGSKPVSLSTGLKAGTTYTAFVSGPAIRVLESADAPDRDTGQGRVYGNTGNLTPYAAITPTAGEAAWAFQVNGNALGDTVVSLIERA